MKDEAESVIDAGADYLHLDIMDGHFVPNLSFGLPVCEAIGKAASIPLDVHLMIEPYEPYLEAFRDIGAARIAVHVEAGPHPHRALQAIRAMGLKSGLALNPGTPVETVAPLLSVCDQVVVMSVNPGFGGQSFLPSALDKLRKARKLIDESGRNIRLEIDGGVKVENIGEIHAAGADTFVAGSAIFGAARDQDPNRYDTVISAMRNALAESPS